MSKSWANITRDAPQKNTKPVVVEQNTIVEVIDTEEVNLQSGFMDQYGYKTSLLWANMKNYIEMKPSLLCKPTSSINLHKFLYNNVYVEPEKLGIVEDESDDCSISEDYVE